MVKYSIIALKTTCFIVAIVALLKMLLEDDWTYIFFPIASLLLGIGELAREFVIHDEYLVNNESNPYVYNNDAYKPRSYSPSKAKDLTQEEANKLVERGIKIEFDKKI